MGESSINSEPQGFYAKVRSVHTALWGDFTDIVKTWQTFLAIVNKLTGVTVLGTLKHDFPGGGFSGVVIIGESHAAIHTWPEDHYGYAELVTCGDPRALQEFVDALDALGRPDFHVTFAKEVL